MKKIRAMLSPEKPDRPDNLLLITRILCLFLCRNHTGFLRLTRPVYSLL